MASNKLLLLIIPLAPLLGAIIAGLFCRVLGNRAAHRITILGVAVSAVLSVMVAWDAFTTGTSFNESLYTWSLIGDVKLEVGFLIDRLTAIMLVVVTSVSLLVHIYTIGYMDGDPGYNRFFSYISLFTFSMLMLVMSNNFLQLFFGWEAVGLVSYLLIGFWYTRETAIYANLKAFLVNRVGDFGFLLGIGLVLAHFGTLDYAQVFAQAGSLKDATMELFPGTPWLVLTVICICLFIGAMGKSAQFPLHVWLPDSMEGPTPISALIHAATMVTAGIFMVARMSPLFELSTTALSVVMIVGAITAFFMALIAVVVYDIKRVVAYSTLSQLGYMTMALGASGYSAAIFHLFTHAFFKAALFLGAGSVIIAMHHEQDMRKMGGLRKYMPLTYLTVLIGAWANAGLPPFAGFFSKESIVEVLHHSTTPGAGIAYAAAVAGVFIGAIYSFRLVFFSFHGKERMDDHTREHLHESPWVVTLPLLTLAAMSICAGWLVGTIVHGDYFGSAIFVGADHPWIASLATDFHGVVNMMLHGFGTLPLWLAIAGVALTWYLYILRPDLPAIIRERLGAFVRVLEDKYGFDRFNDWFFAGGARSLGNGLWQRGDVKIIDGIFVNGSARCIGWLAGVARTLQTGRIYHYAFSMIIGALILVSVWRYVLPHFAGG
ncbi:MAG: NADH-quinone oxidoreductase subunit L [Betaproteobacteria bacterium]|nr:NADH-quinone oxidoreductase subunit L [Betaproteobacteria bacterium]